MNTALMTDMMGNMGRGGDAMMAHFTPGDVIIPREVVLQNPDFLTKFKKAMADMGGDYRSHVAGSGYESINPETGAPEFFFSGVKGFFKNPGRQISNVTNSLLSNPLVSTVGGFLLGGPVGGILGAALSGGLGGGDGGSSATPSLPAPDLGKVAQEFKPTRPNEITAPTELWNRNIGGQAFSALDPTQQRSFLATEGAFGGGLGGEEKDYYLNLLQRNLIDQGGQLGNISTALLPVERNYLSRIGLPTDNTNSFFQALQG